jgi:NADH-quinone oxidoreductase subunit F
MKSLMSVVELDNLRDKARANLVELEKKTQVKVHLSTCGISSGASKILDTFTREVEKLKLANVVVLQASCIGLCSLEPMVTIIPSRGERFVYVELTEDKVRRIVEEHLGRGKPVNEWLLDLNQPMLKLQTIRIMHNQDLDPRDIEQYIGRDGYQALRKVVSGMKPEEVIDEIAKSGLRGRGGAGFPTARKWGFVRSAQSDEKFIVCNADQGDPGAYMNRLVLEGNPHSVIEGMAIGAYAIGSVHQGYAYIRAEYPRAVQNFSHAIRQAQEYGLLGKNILGTGFEFNLSIFQGAGAFVCGEETALLGSIEGGRGNPRQRPPFPANPGGGLHGKPTAINNVETWSHVPMILLNGAKWFASVGNAQNTGTKTLCLVGKARNTGVIEVPLGMPLGTIVFDLGGGTAGGKKYKGVQIGGPSGGVIPVAHLNTPVDYEAIPALGAIMGSGGLVVLDEDNCMVDVAKYFLQFTRDESCGKCTPCRVGIPKMLEILDKITRGEGEMKDLDTLTELAEMVGQASLCGLGQTCPNPVLTTLRYFRDEYEAHIIDKKCPAAVCQGLFKSACQHTCPVGLDIPGYISLIKEGKFSDSYRLIKQRNPLPAICGRVCDHPCEFKCRRGQIDEPIAIRDLKRFASDYAFEHGVEYVPEKVEKKQEKIAVIGAGPAGLSCAWDLAIEGYPVTVFEALPVAGGMVAVAIPEYRMPKDVLKKEIGELEKAGVEIKLNTRVDDVNSLLKQGYKAVFIATGAHKGDKAGIPGEDLSGVFDAIEFLREINLGHKLDVGKKVAVIGGGNSAIDAARVALRKNADEVHVFYRRERKDMPAIAEEVEVAEKEGIIFHFLTNPSRIIGSNGKVSGIELIRQKLGDFDRSGRRTPSAIAGSEFVVPVDMVIEAIGQRPDTSFIKDGEIKTERDGTITVDKRTLFTGREGVFAGGDAVTGPLTVIDAIAAGQRAASSIRRFLRGEPFSQLVERNGYKPIAVSTALPTDEETQERARIKAPQISLRDMKSTFKEATLCYGLEEAQKEASRCLRCDLEIGG